MMSKRNEEYMYSQVDILIFTNIFQTHTILQPVDWVAFRTKISFHYFAVFCDNIIWKHLSNSLKVNAYFITYVIILHLEKCAFNKPEKLIQKYFFSEDESIFALLHKHYQINKIKSSFISCLLLRYISFSCIFCMSRKISFF